LTTLRPRSARRAFTSRRARGTALATYNLTDWTISIANEWTDRVFLAANDGQVICLRHRDSPGRDDEIARRPNMKKPIEKKEEKKERRRKKKRRTTRPPRCAEIAPAMNARLDPGPRIEATALDRAGGQDDERLARLYPLG